MEKSAINFDELLKKIKQDEVFNKINRFKYECVIENSIRVVEEIGKYRYDKFVIDAENLFVYENMIKWVHSDNTMKCHDAFTGKIIDADLKKGVYIAGSTGTGKSWVLEIMSAYTLIDNVKVQFGNDIRQLFWQNYRADLICDEYQKFGNIDKYKNARILGIQDFGTEPNESLFMGNRMNVVQKAIENRGDRTDLLTLITSNIPMSHEIIVKRYEDRVQSRLFEMCNYFELKGKDRRLK